MEVESKRFTKKVIQNGTVISHERYLYRGFLQIVALDMLNEQSVIRTILWDPLEPIATRPLALIQNNELYCYGLDFNKNVTEVFDGQGVIATEYNYSPFGNVTPTDALPQPIQWSSEVYDFEFGLVYYNYRYYNPIGGRWIARDYINRAVSSNLYVFSLNNPLNINDWIGLEAQKQKPLKISEKCPNCKKAAYIFIGGAMDSVYRNMGRFEQSFSQKKQNKDIATAYYYWTQSRYNIANSIRKYRKLCPETKIVLIGHSYGGDTAMDVAEVLDKTYQIVLITLDPVGEFDMSNYRIRKPASVRYWINAYVGKGPQDTLAVLPIAGQIVSGIITLLSGTNLSNSIASLGGKWGEEAGADVNIEFDYYGDVSHGDAKGL